MAEYVRCTAGGECTRGTARRPGSPTSPTPADILITAGAAAAAAGVTPCAAPCACYIIARHWTKSGSDWSFDEKLYPGTVAGTGSTNLSQADERANHPGKTAPGGSATDYWTVKAECLKLDASGAPLLAMALELQLPEGEYAALHSELIRRLGKGHVKELKLPGHPSREDV